VTDFQHLHVDLTSTISDLRCVPLLSALMQRARTRFLAENQCPSPMKASYNDMDFEAEIRALACRNISAADSGVMSRCGPPSSSNPTMNLRIAAERSKGG
jgi:hypothetical protein